MQNLQSEYAARNVAIGLALTVFATALLLFLIIAVAVARSDTINAIDSSVGMWLHVRATPLLTGVMAAVSFLGAPTSISVVAVACSLLLLCQRNWADAATLSIVVLGGNFLNFCLKHIVQRGRPVFDDPIFSLPTYSFPSGHAMASTVFCGLLAIHASAQSRQRVSARVAIGTALVIVALVCFSRMYLGLHYLSDVTAGVAEGVALLALSFAALRYIRRDESSAGVAGSP
jgi:membrane-associated phospholipid phosphatase